MPDFGHDNGPDPYESALSGLADVLSWMHLDGAHYPDGVPVDVLSAEHLGLVKVVGRPGGLRPILVVYEPTPTGWRLAVQGTNTRWRLASKVSP